MSTYPKFSVRDDQKNAHISVSSIALSGNLNVVGAASAKANVIATTTALSVSDSGAKLLPSAGSAQTFTLPLASTGAGVTFTFVAGSAQAHVIATKGLEAKLQGHVIDATNGNTFADNSVSDGKSITLVNPEIGDTLVIRGDGTSWYVSGMLNQTPTIAT